MSSPRPHPIRIMRAWRRNPDAYAVTPSHRNDFGGEKLELFPAKPPLGPSFDSPFGDRQEGGTVRFLEGGRKDVARGAVAPFAAPAREARGR